MSQNNLLEPSAQSVPKIFKAAKTNMIQHQGPFTLHLNLPGYNVPGAVDHGYGAVGPDRRLRA